MHVAPIEPLDPGHLQALHALQQAAYLREARILGIQDFPPLRETLATLRGTRERLMGAWEGETLVGVLGSEPEDGHHLITRLAVDPGRFRKGVGSLLLAHFISRHGQAGLSVQTGMDNVPALRIYQKHGFLIMQFSRSQEGIRLVRLVRPAP